MKKFDTYPAQLVNCSVHPGCSCLEAQDINCISCNSEEQISKNQKLLEEEEEETNYQKWLRYFHSTKDESLEYYLNLQEEMYREVLEEEQEKKKRQKEE